MVILITSGITLQRAIQPWPQKVRWVSGREDSCLHAFTSVLSPATSSLQGKHGTQSSENSVAYWIKQIHSECYRSVILHIFFWSFSRFLQLDLFLAIKYFLPDSPYENASRLPSSG